MARFYEYVLEFSDKEQADSVLNPIKRKLRFPWRFSRYDIGQIKKYVYDENDPEAEPEVIIVNENYFVHVKVRKPESSLDEYVSNEDIGHEFS